MKDFNLILECKKKMKCTQMFMTGLKYFWPNVWRHVSLFKKDYSDFCLRFSWFGFLSTNIKLKLRRFLLKTKHGWPTFLFYSTSLTHGLIFILIRKVDNNQIILFFPVVCHNRVPKYIHSHSFLTCPRISNFIELYFTD